MAASGADADAARGARDHPADSLLSLEEARAAIEALDAEAKAVRGALKTRTAEVEAMRASLAPAEARLAATRAELGLFAGADSVARKEADAAAAIAETEATVVEQRAMVEHLTGCEIVEVKPDAGDLTMRVRTQIPRCPEAALEPVDGTRARARARGGWRVDGPRRPPLGEDAHDGGIVPPREHSCARGVSGPAGRAHRGHRRRCARRRVRRRRCSFFAGERRQDARGGGGAARRGRSRARRRRRPWSGRASPRRSEWGSTTVPGGSRPWTCPWNGRSTARAYGLWASPAWRRRLWLPPRRASTGGTRRWRRRCARLRTRSPRRGT